MDALQLQMNAETLLLHPDDLLLPLLEPQESQGKLHLLRPELRKTCNQMQDQACRPESLLLLLQLLQPHV